MKVLAGLIHLYEGQHLHLLPEKAIFWEEDQALLLADLHLGKAAHFRKAGIPIPQSAQYKDFMRLKALLDHYQPKRVYFLGDLFHSHKNNDLSFFKKIIKPYAGIQKMLVKGNHDILQEEEYHDLGLELSHSLEKGPFLLRHDPLLPFEKFSSSWEWEEEPKLIAGHLHPSVALKGKAGQRLRLPCFFFSKKALFLPAFGSLTGLAEVKISKTDQVFVVAEGKVIPIELK